MVTVFVNKPVATENQYLFPCIVEGKRLKFNQLSRKFANLITGRESLKRWEYVFGFYSVDFAIQHHPLWDSFYPLFRLIRNKGPVYRSSHTRLIIRFAYPVHEDVAAFFIRRAKKMGYDLKVEADFYSTVWQEETKGHGVAFGGGKDSRLILGILEEYGYNPVAYASGIGLTGGVGTYRTTDISKKCVPGLADRIMAGFMALPEKYYFGSGLGEVHLEEPWHQYYDCASPTVLAETSDLFRSLGFDITVSAPAAILPYNIIQSILYKRYPDLYSHQISVAPQSKDDKNLHISLLKKYHNIDYHQHCSEELFKNLLVKYLKKQKKGGEHGFRNNRKVIDYEMRSIIAQLGAEGKILLSAEIPSSWNDTFIDYIHSYVDPEADPAFLEVYKKYAKKIPANFTGYMLP